MQASLGEYHALRLKLAELEKKMMVEVLRPERVLIFLQPGRLVCFSLCVENKPF
jgi:ATP-dependent RNA helicase DOB1